MVYFPSSIITLLQTHIEGLPLDCNIIFPNTKYQGYINLENFRRRVWKPLLIASGIDERCRIHDIRGVYVNISLNNGATIKFVQNQLGHAKSQTTLDVCK